MSSETISKAAERFDQRKSDQLLYQEFTRNFKEIGRQSAIFFAGTIFTMAAGYFVKIYVARVLGAENLGLYALGMTVVSFVQLFGLLGLPGTAARYVAVYNGTRNHNALRALLSATTLLLLGLNLLIAVGMVLGREMAGRFYHSPDLPRYMPLFAILMFLGAISSYYSQVMAGLKDVAKRTLITNFIGTPLVLTLTVLLLALGTGLWGYMVAQVLATTVVVGLLARVAWKLVPPSDRLSGASHSTFSREIVSFSAATLGMSALDFLVSQADKVLLGFYLNARVLGMYVLASTLVSFVPIVLQSVNQIFAPAIADLLAQGQKQVLGRLYQTLTKWVLGVTLPLALVIIVLAPQFMRLFGTEFEAAWSVLVIGTLGQIVNCAVGSAGFLLLMSGNQKRLLRVQVGSAVLSIGLNLLLIPRFGMVGAAVSATIINAGSNLWNLQEVRNALGLSPYNRGYLRLFMPTALALGILSIYRVVVPQFVHASLGMALGLVLAYFVFGGTSVIALDEDDWLIARSAWGQLHGGLHKFAART